MQKVEGSNPFIRSMYPITFRGAVAEGLRHGSAKPDTPVQVRPAPLSYLPAMRRPAVVKASMGVLRSLRSFGAARGHASIRTLS